METGYTMLCEQTSPKQLVSDLVRAEEIGFGFSVISDHYFRWPEAQGHSPYAWSVLGAAAQATGRLFDGGYVNYAGTAATVDSAKLYDLPETRGPDLGPYLDAARAYSDAGFTHVALVQVGAERQRQFFEFAEPELLPALRGQ